MDRFRDPGLVRPHQTLTAKFCPYPAPAGTRQTPSARHVLIRQRRRRDPHQPDFLPYVNAGFRCLALATDELGPCPFPSSGAANPSMSRLAICLAMVSETPPVSVLNDPRCFTVRVLNLCHAHSSPPTVSPIPNHLRTDLVGLGTDYEFENDHVQFSPTYWLWFTWLTVYSKATRKPM